MKRRITCRHRGKGLFVPWLGLAIAMAAPRPADAQSTDGAPAAVEQPLRLLNARERRALSPYLERGPALLVEFAPEGQLPGIVLAARVNAPADEVAEVLTHPEGYPRFMPALDRVRVESRRGPQTAYSWSWRLALFTLRGRNVMTTLPGSARRGYRIDVRATGGDMGTGRMTWRVFPEGDHSLVVFASRIDMRHANWVSGQLAQGGQSVNRTINIALASVMLLGTKAEAERRAGTTSAAAVEPPAPLALAPVGFEALMPLLVRGDLALMDMRGDRLDDVMVIGRVGAGVPETREVMVDPEAFSRSLMHGARATVAGEDARGTLFDWEIPLPLIRVAGRMRLSEEGTVVGVDGVRGALAHGRWRFDTHRLPWGEACLYGIGRFDPAETSPLVRGVIGDDAFFSHGLVAGMQIMVVRSVRTRVLRRVEEARAAAARARREAAEQARRQAAQAGRRATAEPTEGVRAVAARRSARARVAAARAAAARARAREAAGAQPAASDAGAGDAGDAATAGAQPAASDAAGAGDAGDAATAGADASGDGAPQPLPAGTRRQLQRLRLMRPLRLPIAAPGGARPPAS